MTRVDFYILPEGSTENSVLTACKLCEKATNAGMKVYIHAPGASLADELDSALWSFQQGAGFISHERYLGRPPEEPLPAVLIGDSEPPESHKGALINMGLEVPAYFSRFERVLELVSGDPTARAKSRERYKFYRERGHELKSHNL